MSVYVQTKYILLHSSICWYKFKPIKLLLSSIWWYKFKPIIYCCLLQCVDICSNQLYTFAFFHMLINVQPNYILLHSSICWYKFKPIKLLLSSIWWYKFKPITYCCLLQCVDKCSNQLFTVPFFHILTNVHTNYIMLLSSMCWYKFNLIIYCCLLQYVDISSNQLYCCCLQFVDISSHQVYTVAFSNMLI